MRRAGRGRAKVPGLEVPLEWGRGVHFAGANETFFFPKCGRVGLGSGTTRLALSLRAGEVGMLLRT